MPPEKGATSNPFADPGINPGINPFTNPKYIEHSDSSSSISSNKTQISHAGPSNSEPTITNYQKKKLQDCTEAFAQRHNDWRPLGDVVRHHGRVASHNAVMFLNEVNLILQRPAPVLPDKGGRLHREISNDQAVELLTRFLAAVPALDTDTYARKDPQVIAIATAHKVFKKADREEAFSSEQLNRLGSAAADLAMRADKTPHDQSFKSEFKRAAKKVIDIGNNSQEAVFPKSWKGKPPLWLATLGPALALAIPVGVAEAARRTIVSQDKTSSHALGLLTAIIKKISSGQVDPALFEQCRALLEDFAGSTHGKDLSKALHARATPQQQQALGA